MHIGAINRRNHTESGWQLVASTVDSIQLTMAAGMEKNGFEIQKLLDEFENK